MKKLLLGTLLLLSTLSFSQETEFRLGQEGLTPFVVTSVDGKTQSELYKKTLNWILITFKNPKEVIKAQIENDYIRIEGSSENLVCFPGLGDANCSSSRYQVEIEFQDNKYKFSVISVEQFGSRWNSIDTWFKSKSYMTNSGEVRSNYKYFYKIPLYFNDLNKDLQKNILTYSTDKKKDW
jgi:hypothetical protein